MKMLEEYKGTLMTTLQSNCFLLKEKSLTVARQRDHWLKSEMRTSANTAVG